MAEKGFPDHSYIYAGGICDFQKKFFFLLRAFSVFNPVGCHAPFIGLSYSKHRFSQANSIVSFLKCVF